MKNLSLIVIFIFITSFSAKAQIINPKFGIGVNAEIFSLPSNSDIEQSSVDVFASYTIKSKFQILLASRSSKLLNTANMQYENNNAGMLGLGYFFQKDSSNFSILAQIMYGNTFNKKASYNEHMFDLGVNFYFFKMFYIGTGLKAFHLEDTQFTDLPQYNINWYWRIGFQLGFAKKK